MATFKITIDLETDLGQHIQKLSYRGRSRELYMLASVGLNYLKRSSHIDNDTLEVKMLDKLTNEMAVNIEQPIHEEKQSVTVDFGDELLSL